MALTASLATVVRLTVAVPMLLACSERATAPSPLARGAGTAAVSSRAIDAGLSTLAWQDTARSLVASHPTVTLIVATRAYALLGVAQYAAVVAADADKNNGQGSSGRALYEARRGAIA